MKPHLLCWPHDTDTPCKSWYVTAAQPLESRFYHGWGRTVEAAYADFYAKNKAILQRLLTS